MANVLSSPSLELLYRYKSENRCMNCKKQSFQDKVMCGKCLEFEYCSVQCLELDRESHQPQCTVISLKKSTCLPISELYLKTIVGKAKLLDNEDNFRDQNDAVKELDAMRNKNIKSNLTRPIHQSLIQTDNKPRKQKKKRSRKRGNPDLKFTHGNKNTVAAHEILLNIDRGKFGGPTKCGSRELSGIQFGQGWWTAGRKTSSGIKIRSPGESLDSLNANRTTKLKFNDFYPEYDEDIKGKYHGTGDSHVINRSKLDNPIAKEKNSLQNVYTDSNNHITLKSKQNLLEHGLELDDIKASFVSHDQQQQQQSAASASPALKKCSHCGKESVTLKLCTRCRVNRYCDHICQKKDYKQHKDQCIRYKRFHEASRKFTKDVILPLITNETLQESDVDQCILNPIRETIMVEIIESINIHFGFIVQCTNAQGLPSTVTFDLKARAMYTGVLYNHGTVSTKPLEECLKPGNFIILVNKSWKLNSIGVPCMTINDIKDIHFVFM